MTDHLGSDYKVEIDQITRNGWIDCLGLFSDANLYQMWMADKQRFSRKKVSHLILKKNGQIVAASEVRLFKLPIWDKGFAYIRWGPLWKKRDVSENPEIFVQAIRALRNEYVFRRGLVLRIYPREVSDESNYCFDALLSEGFVPVNKKKDKTIILDLSCQSEELRKGFAQKWRNQLNKAEKSDLTLVVGKEMQLFDEFVSLYKQLLKRKKFQSTTDIKKHRLLQSNLPEDYKMTIIISRQKGESCAGAIISAVGDTAVYLFGATNDIGLKTSASYLVQWHLLSILKDHGILKYDLNGINPEYNPGTYRFKKGLGGNKSQEINFLGQYQSYQTSIANDLILNLEKSLSNLRNIDWRTFASKKRHHSLPIQNNKPGVIEEKS